MLFSRISNRTSLCWFLLFVFIYSLGYRKCQKNIGSTNNVVIWIQYYYYYRYCILNRFLLLMSDFSTITPLLCFFTLWINNFYGLGFIHMAPSSCFLYPLFLILIHIFTTSICNGNLWISGQVNILKCKFVGKWSLNWI